MLLVWLVFVGAAISVLSQPALVSQQKMPMFGQQRHPLEHLKEAAANQAQVPTSYQHNRNLKLYQQGHFLHRNIPEAISAGLNHPPSNLRSPKDSSSMKRMLIETAGIPIGIQLSSGSTQQTPVNTTSTTNFLSRPANDSTAANGSTRNRTNDLNISALFDGLAPFQPKHGGYQPGYKEVALKPLVNATKNSTSDVVQANVSSNGRVTKLEVVSSSRSAQNGNTSFLTPISASPPISTFALVLHCASYDRNGACVLCEANFTLVGGECRYNSGKTSQFCSVPGYLYGPSGQCLRADPHCVLPTADNLCSKCQSGFQLSNGVCYMPELLNCSTKEQGYCLSCPQGYGLDEGGFCVRFNKNCKYYNSTSNCLTCSESSQLISGNCEPIKIESLCLVKKNGLCVRCMPYATFNLNQTCVLSDPNCNVLNESGFCAKCKPGYLLLQRQCVQTRPVLFRSLEAGCDVWSDTICISSSSCQPRSECTTVNQANGNCTGCLSNFVLVRGRCVSGPAADDPCRLYAADGTQCEACRTGFTSDSKGGCSRIQ